MPRITRITAALAVSLGLCSVSASAQTDLGTPNCGDTVTALKEYRTFGELLLRLTRDQIQQAAEAKYQIGLKALEKGWSTGEEQAFISRFLTLPQYFELQQEREPHQATLAAAQSRWRRTNDPAAHRELCESFRTATLALKSFYDIGQKEQAALRHMLASE
jgi:hypothetical protein